MIAYLRANIFLIAGAENTRRNKSNESKWKQILYQNGVEFVRLNLMPVFLFLEKKPNDYISNQKLENI